MFRTLVSSVVVAVTLSVLALSVSAQQNSMLGTWRLNVAKSTYSPGPGPRSQTVRNEAAPGGGMKAVVDGVDAAGKPIHNEITTMFDGKEAVYQGAAQPTTRAYTRIDDRTIQWVQKVNGKVTTTTRSTVSADGKTRTNTTTGADEQGRQVKNVVVYERQ